MPEEYIALAARRTLWQEYGIVVPDFEFGDAILALRLHGAEAERMDALIKRTKGGG